MISAGDFCAALAGHGIGFIAGVPCSGLAGPIELLSAQQRYVAAANEGAALAMAAGAAATGGRSGVFSQNSGFGNLLNPLTSLVMPYGIGVVVFLSMRGWPDPAADEPQHQVMGRCTGALLDALGVASWPVPADATEKCVLSALEEAVAEADRGRPAFLLIAKGAIAGNGRAAGQADSAGLVGDGLERADVVRRLIPLLDKTPVVATTGYTARDLFAAGDSPYHFYMQGSMGHAAAFAFGLARQRAGTGPVVVLDGDGAMLMHLGTVSTIGAAAPARLVHVVFDNGCYESTGGQPTTSGTVDFPAIAMACGYASACRAARLAEVEAALADRLAAGGPHLIVVPTRPAGGPAPPRATSALAPADIYRRFGHAAGQAGRRADGHGTGADGRGTARGREGRAASDRH